MNVNRSISNHFNLNWLTKQYKGISVIPDIVIEDKITIDGRSVGGCYYRPCVGELYVNGTPYDMNNGVVLVNATNCCDIQSTIAHEFRHHLQAINGVKFNGSVWSIGDSYKESIIKYFINSTTEMDALIYERHVCGGISVDTDEWFDWIINYGDSIGKRLDGYIDNKVYSFGC